MSAFFVGALAGTMVAVLVLGPWVYMLGYLSGNDDGVHGWRSVGLFKRRVR